MEVLNTYYVIDVFTKYVRVNLLKDKKAKAVLHGFIKIINESNKGVIKEENSTIVQCKNG